MALKQQVIDVKGKDVSSMTLSEAVFGTSVSPRLLALAVRVFLSNQRQGSKHVQGRSDVNRTKKKVWRQKGTGNARHGARSAPIFVGGGKAHRPDGTENYRMKLTKKMRRRALVGALSAKLADKGMVIVDDLSVLKGKAKAASDFLKATSLDGTKQVLIVLDTPEEGVLRAFSNVSNVTVAQAHRLTAYEVLACPTVVFAKKAVGQLEDRLSNSAPVIAEKKERSN